MVNKFPELDGLMDGPFAVREGHGGGIPAWFSHRRNRNLRSLDAHTGTEPSELPDVQRNQYSVSSRLAENPQNVPIILPQPRPALLANEFPELAGLEDGSSSVRKIHRSWYRNKFRRIKESHLKSDDAHTGNEIIELPDVQENQKSPSSSLETTETDNNRDLGIETHRFHDVLTENELSELPDVKKERQVITIIQEPKDWIGNVMTRGRGVGKHYICKKIPELRCVKKNLDFLSSSMEKKKQGFSFAVSLKMRRPQLLPLCALLVVLFVGFLPNLHAQGTWTVTRKNRNRRSLDAHTGTEPSELPDIQRNQNSVSSRLAGRFPPVKMTETEERHLTGRDVVFLLDGTDDTITSFPTVRDFVQRVVERLLFDNNKYRVSVVQYSRDPTVQFYLNTYTTKEDIIEAVRRLTHKGGETRNTGAALQFLLRCFIEDEEATVVAPMCPPGCPVCGIPPKPECSRK
ncbi:collagen alpha-3(VI) chain-like%2C partial [Xyrichtys novacula]|uniref:Collagen alpha-3(VI) chain-like, partial n=1 Tax=Xyrichtys novacula TaxID=13765 RepID=A0AAV1GYQ0_XYRNO|nr:collagen alpha-3(VI) chain-like%2C partial [Xyrichtys novacula]